MGSDTNGWHTAMDNGRLQDEINAERIQADANKRATDPTDGTGALNPRTAQAKIANAQQHQAAANSGGFQLNPAEIEEQLADAAEHITSLRALQAEAMQAAKVVEPPAPDEASVAHANQARQTLENGAKVIQSYVDYWTAWQKTVEDAKQSYMTAEHLTEEQWQKLTKGLEA